MAKLTTQQKVQVGALALLGVASLYYGGYRWWLTTAPPMPQTIEQAVALHNDPRYQGLPPQRRAAYIARSRELYEQLDDDAKRQWRQQMREDPEARAAARDAMREQMLNRARDFTLADEAERNKILDQTINMMIAAEAAGRMRNRAGGNDRERPELTEEEQQQREQRRAERREQGRRQIQQMIEQGDPQRQAYVGEFFKALRERREERGLEPMPDFRRGR